MSSVDSRHFFVAMIPPKATKQEANVSVDFNGKPHWYPSERWRKAEADIASRLERFRPDEPIAGSGVGVMLSVEWCFPLDGHADGSPYLEKPDTDNLDKGLKDIMTRLGWWDDDARVFAEIIVKIHSRIPGIRIDIEEVRS